MWEFLEILLAILVAGWLLDQEPPARPGVLRLVRGDAPEPERDAEPPRSRAVPRRR